MEHEDFERRSAAEAGLSALDQQEAARRGRMRDQDEIREGRVSRPSSGSDAIGLGASLTVLIGIPVMIGWVLVAGVGKGSDWLANDSPLAWIFPGSAAGLATYVVSSAALLLVVSGGLFAAAALLGDRFTPLRRLVLVPLAVLSVPMVLFATVSTTMR
jgi:hypothetical protein